jgi:hypothetical protein
MALKARASCERPAFIDEADVEASRVLQRGESCHGQNQTRCVTRPSTNDARDCDALCRDAVMRDDLARPSPSSRVADHYSTRRNARSTNLVGFDAKSGDGIQPLRTQREMQALDA